MPGSAIMITRSLKLSLKLVYQLTHRMMICPSKCRLLKSARMVKKFVESLVARRSFQKACISPTGPSWRSTPTLLHVALLSRPPHVIGLEHDPVNLSGEEMFLPVRATETVRDGRRLLRYEITFQDCPKFS